MMNILDTSRFVPAQNTFGFIGHYKSMTIATRFANYNFTALYRLTWA